ncbi:MAG: RNA polymerase sigma factor [Candidatus Methylacidiphilales bacterium]
MSQLSNAEPPTLTDSPGDRTSWLKTAWERYESPLLGYTRQITGDLEEARDVVQDSFVKLCRERPAKVGDPPGAWLYRVCRNRALDLYRRRIKNGPVGSDIVPEGICPQLTPDTAADASTRQRVVAELMAELTPTQRELVRLKFMDQLSYREIATITGLSVGNVGVHLHHAMKRLRERLHHEQAPPHWKETLPL